MQIHNTHTGLHFVIIEQDSRFASVPRHWQNVLRSDTHLQLQ